MTSSQSPFLEQVRQFSLGMLSLSVFLSTLKQLSSSLNLRFPWETSGILRDLEETRAKIMGFLFPFQTVIVYNESFFFMLLFLVSSRR